MSEATLGFDCHFWMLISYDPMTFFHFQLSDWESWWTAFHELPWVSMLYLFDSKFNITLWQRRPFCLTCLSKPKKYVAFDCLVDCVQVVFNIHQYPINAPNETKPTAHLETWRCLGHLIQFHARILFINLRQELFFFERFRAHVLLQVSLGLRVCVRVFPYPFFSDSSFW